MSSSNRPNASQSGQHDCMSAPSQKAGTGWTRGATRCRISLDLSNHGKGPNKTWPKGDRGLGKHELEVVLRETGVFVQPGSGKILKTQPLKTCFLQENSIPVCQETPLNLIGVPCTGTYRSMGGLRAFVRL